MPVYTVHEAKTNLSKLIERAERGEEVVIARGDKPVVKLTVVGEKSKTRRQPGMLKGVIPEFPDSFFFDPLPEDELKLWEEGYDGDPLNEPAARKPDATSS
jgi:prevent-host-death family protein